MFEQAFNKLNGMLWREAGCASNSIMPRRHLYRRESWAAPKGKDGQLHHNTALSNNYLRNFVNLMLFPYLHKSKDSASVPNAIECKIGKIFGGDEEQGRQRLQPPRDHQPCRPSALPIAKRGQRLPHRNKPSLLDELLLEIGSDI